MRRIDISSGDLHITLDLDNEEAVRAHGTILCDELSRLRASLAAVTKERDEARTLAEEACRRYNELIASGPTLTCAFCGSEYPRGTPPSQHEALTAHVLVCEKHPLRSRLAIAVQAERERCTKIADEMAKSYDASWRELREKKNRANDARECSHKATACEIIAAAIRAGKEVGT